MKWQFEPAVARRYGRLFSLSPIGRYASDHSAWHMLVIALVAYSCVLRVVYSAQVELLPEEAYYWNYSRHLDIGYLDHPPLVAWLIRLGTLMFGDTEFGIRASALACGAVTSWFTYRLTRNLFGRPSALVSLVLTQTLPFFFFSGMLMTPDAPLTAAWAGTMFFLERALLGGRANAWLYAGLCMGMGLLSKYTIGLLGLATLLFMVVDAPSRRWLRRWQPYAAASIAALVFAPVIFWNAQHEWASFLFQTSRRLGEAHRFSLHKLIAAALVLITPMGFFAVVTQFTGRRRRAALTGPAEGSMVAVARVAAALPCQAVTVASGAATTAVGDGEPRASRFLGWTLLMPLAVFAIFSLRHEIKLDWTGAPWVAAVPAMAFGIVGLYARQNTSPFRGRRLAWSATLLSLLVFYGAGSYYLVRGLPGVGYTAHMELVPIGWRDLGRQMDEVVHDTRSRYGPDVLMVGMDRYATASELAFYSRDQTTAVAGTSAAHLFDDMGLMYEQWFPVQRQAGRTLLLVSWDPNNLDAMRLGRYVGELLPVQQGTVTRDGTDIRRFYYRVARAYRGTRAPRHGERHAL